MVRCAGIRTFQSILPEWEMITFYRKWYCSGELRAEQGGGEEAERVGGCADGRRIDEIPPPPPQIMNETGDETGG